MPKFIIIISAICILFFVLWGVLIKRRKNGKHNEKPPFRTEKDIEEYGKPMEDQDSNPVNFDDA